MDLNESSHITIGYNVFSIPEILGNILDLASSQSRVEAARVCRAWSSPALDQTWREIPGVFPLLALLAPMTVADGKWGFSSDVSLADWDRFEQYARRVRILKQLNSMHDQRVTNISEEAFAAFLLHRPEGPILPHLKAIHCVAHKPNTLLQLLPFATSTVTTLDVLATMGAVSTCDPFFRSLSKRLSALQVFRFDTVGQNQQWMSSLATFLSGRESLISAILPFSFSASAEVMKALAALPALRECGIYTTKKHIAVEQGSPQFNWAVGAFPMLRRLHFTASLRRAVDMLDRMEQGENLKQFIFDTTVAYSAEDIHDLAERLTRSFTALEVISLSLFPEAASEPIAFHSIRALLQCPLIELSIASRTPLTTTEGDVVAMGRAWPGMTTLSLCRDPFHVAEGLGMSLQMLDVFSHHFPRLESLGVFVVDDTVSVGQGHRGGFMKLKWIDVGTSPAFDNVHMRRVQTYLSRILPGGASILATRTKGHLDLVRTNGRDRQIYAGRADFWSGVEEGLKMIQEEKAHLLKENAQLIKENAGLMMENADLRCQLSVRHGGAF
ncbi:hypothetical protein FRB94_001943 [Tulasnella sp. JGI-2019a]|nr:hypothetical protein FRB93_005754 [Tulasnella sp. JGI-2019a]KAG9004974.1 hypothetical protein FRB94_001943 [Tulasnella sp. JGI-2019a]